MTQPKSELNVLFEIDLRREHAILSVRAVSGRVALVSSAERQGALRCADRVLKSRNRGLDPNLDFPFHGRPLAVDSPGWRAWSAEAQPGGVTVRILKAKIEVWIRTSIFCSGHARDGVSRAERGLLGYPVATRAASIGLNAARYAHARYASSATTTLAITSPPGAKNT